MHLGCQAKLIRRKIQILSTLNLNVTTRKIETENPFLIQNSALLVGGGLLVPCPLPGPPVVKQLMQMATMVPGQGGQFQSVCFP